MAGGYADMTVSGHAAAAALEKALGRAWSAATAWPPMREGWSVENPAHGQCLVTALAVRKRLGGHLVMGTAHIPGREGDPVLHFRNRLPQGDVDLTWRQFPPGTVFREMDPAIPENRALYDECLNDGDTSRRHEILEQNLPRFRQGR